MRVGEPRFAAVAWRAAPGLAARRAGPDSAANHRMEHWYGTWHGRLSGLPTQVILESSPLGANEGRGRISSLLITQTFTGRFHGEILVFR